ncbi:MAG: MFS transporter [SAR86 cluster bacterium]|uniref:MFS transporter n=1 Tax=SAR86 cluster bacterium TaxID=2030880 RepID=A0A2A4X639_9GAMM|nr:MAG: MFS transporter [SAR86 cluster bacterium]
MTQSTLSKTQLEGNLRRFIIFRLFYSARFYYPVFTVLFLDYGLTLEQFAILNIVWALTIVLAEVPSGALADSVGRKRLVVFAAIMMVIEMGLIVFAPIGASPLLFLLFLANRICSGLSEAAASGADEALAYDSLKALGREDDWARILQRTTQVVSVGFFMTMILGAFAYDPNMVNGLLSAIDPQWQLSNNLVIRLPVILTLVTSFIVLGTALGFHDIDIEEDKPSESKQQTGTSLLEPFRKIVIAAKWTVGHRFVLFVILAALALDSVGRQFAVLASEYYRVIDIPVSWFGFIGAGMSLVGMVNAIFSRYLVTNHSPLFNFLTLSGLLMAGLIGLGFAIPYYGVIFAVGAFAMMGMVQFQSSYYINKEVDSVHRATVLSFKGLALNLGLGFASLLYTAYVVLLRTRQEGVVPEETLRDLIFLDALRGFPIYFLALFLILMLLGRALIKPRSAVLSKR